MKAKIEEAKAALQAAAGDGTTLTFVSVPDVFFGGPSNSASTIAFAPGLANSQIVAGAYYFPRPYAALNAAGKDIFEEAVRARLDNALFVDDWSFYHTSFGEVHCASLVKREVWDKAWWTLQP